MQLFSATDAALTRAIASDTLRIIECVSERTGNPYIALEDEHGLIEVHLSMAEAQTRIRRLSR